MGSPPRTAEFFRPLLEDIRNVLSTWRKKRLRNRVRTVIIATVFTFGILVSLGFLFSTILDPFRNLPPAERQAVMVFSEKGTVYAIDPDKGIVSLQISWLPDDSDFVHLYKLSNLRSLVIANAPVTDQDLKKHFGRLKRVKRLVFINTKVTDQGVVTLQKALPDCSISAEQMESWR